jgi:hypothetical protein
MNLSFLKPNRRKVAVFLILIFVTPFIYFYNYNNAEWGDVSRYFFVFGFPPLITFLPDIFYNTYMNGNFYNGDPGLVQAAVYNSFMLPFHLIFIYILSCLAVWIYDKVKK